MHFLAAKQNEAYGSQLNQNIASPAAKRQS